MDPLAHTLVGVALARTPLGRRTRLGSAAAVIGANLPDLDVLSYAWGPDAAFGFRRGLTHGVLALLALPVALAAVLLLYDRWARRRRPELPRAAPAWVFAVSAIAITSHPLLDWLNSYGVRLLMPFEGRWFYGDALFIVDPWVWLILGTAVFLGSAGTCERWVLILLALAASVLVLGARAGLPAAAKIVWISGLALAGASQRIARRFSSEHVASWGLAVALAYLAVPLGISMAGPPWVERELGRRGISGVEDLMVAPTPADPFRWSVIVETGDRYLPGSFSWGLGGFALDLDEPAIEKLRPTPILEAARRAPGVQGTLGWMRFPFAEIEETASGYTVHFLDARYVRTRVHGFGSAVVRLDRELRPLVD